MALINGSFFKLLQKTTRKRLTINEPKPRPLRLMIKRLAGVGGSVPGDTQMAKIRSLYRTGIFAAATLAICGILLSPAQAADSCTGTLAQYGATIKQLETFSASTVNSCRLCSKGIPDGCDLDSTTGSGPPPSANKFFPEVIACGFALATPC